MSPEEMDAGVYAHSVITDDAYYEVPADVARGDIAEAWLSGFRRGGARSRRPDVVVAQSYARCPGCGQNADAKHMAACVTMARDERDAATWKRGAEFVLAVIRAHVGRHGAVDVAKVVDAVESVGRVENWWNRPR